MIRTLRQTATLAVLIVCFAPAASTALREPPAPVAAGTTTRAGSNQTAPASAADSIETRIQLAGVIVATLAAIFSALSAGGAMAAANEMRAARRDALTPRLSFRIIDRSMTIRINDGISKFPRADFDQTPIAEDDSGFRSLSRLRIELVNFASAALNVRVRFSFESDDASDFAYFKSFLRLPPDGTIRVSRWGYFVDAPGHQYALAARKTADAFLPHIGSTQPKEIEVPPEIIQRYIVAVAGRLPSGIQDHISDLPLLRISIQCMGVDGEAYEQGFLLDYQFAYYKGGDAPEVRLNVRELDSDPIRRIEPKRNAGAVRGLWG